MSFLNRVAACNIHNLSHFRPFLVGDVQIGWVRPNLVRQLVSMRHIFEPITDGIMLNPTLQSVDERSTAMSEAVDILVAGGHVPSRRGEDYGVRSAWSEPVLFAIDRAAVTSFGLLAFGVHVNGFIRRPDGIHMWIAKRARDRLVDPGKLDTLVGGGHPHGLTVRENLIKECGEEAGIGQELALEARPVGAHRYVLEVDRGLKRDVHFLYDLELTDAFTPRNVDGEVESFHLRPIEEVARQVRDTEDFKFNIGPVIVDFMIRHGMLSPDDPDYLAIVLGLRAGAD